MATDPWSMSAKGTEHGEQSALFQWANMAALYGFDVASFREAYTVPLWAKEHAKANRCGPIPALTRLYAINNAVGANNVVRGAMNKAEGVKRGVPDIFLPVPRRCGDLDKGTWYNAVVPFSGFGNASAPVVCGLYVELKRRTTKTAEGKRRQKGKTFDEQDEWIDYLSNAGYACVVAVGWERAAAYIRSYIEGTAVDDV